MKKTWKHSWAAAIFGATAFVTTSTSQADVIVYWEEVPNGATTDVVATWTGSMDPGDSSALFTVSASTINVGNGGFLVLRNGDSAYLWGGGSRIVTDLPAIYDSPSTSDFESMVTPGSSFGFLLTSFYYDSDAISGDPNSTTINFDSTLHTLTFPGRTLEGMNADGFDNTLAWTSSSGDTISYTTRSPSTVSAIPEPSSGLVLGFLLLSGLIHRRRK